VRLTGNLKAPSFVEEEILVAQGFRHIAGVDEAGRGPLAGPVVAAAVILPRDIDTPWLNLVRDSKQLSSSLRELLFHHIHEVATGIGVGVVDAGVIDRQGIIKATRLAMKSAIEQLRPLPESLLIDHISLPEVKLPQNCITRGDSLCFSIACASIIAKVERDHRMIELDKDYPGYGLASHKGYGTREHLACLRRLGPSPVLRYSFRPVRDM